MFKGHLKTGTVTGTGAAINVVLGFVPAVVLLFNKTDPGVFIWTKDMANASALKLTDAPALTFPTSNGITPYEGVAGTTGKGFTIGADSDLNAASDVLYYVAFGDE
jgi:hypothetical protein